MKKTDLTSLAEAINSLCELAGDDRININQSAKALEKELTNVVSGDEPELDIYEEDEFSDEAWKVLYELGCQTAIDKLDRAEEDEVEEEAEPDAEGDEDDEDDDEEAESDGDNEEKDKYTIEVIQTMKLKDLKQLVKDEDLDIDVKKYKKQKDLAEAVLRALELVDEDEDEEDQYTAEDIQVPKEETEPEKKKEKPKVRRPESVIMAVEKLCSKRTAYKEINKEADKIFVENGGKEGSTATNVVSYILEALVYYKILDKNDEGYKKSKK